MRHVSSMNQKNKRDHVILPEMLLGWIRGYFFAAVQQEDNHALLGCFIPNNLL
jgi:hypothetical protein